MSHPIFKGILLFAFVISLPVSALNPKLPEADLSAIKGSHMDFFHALPYLQSPYVSLNPEKKKDGIAVGRISKDSGILELAREIADDKHGNYDSLLIAHKGQLVFESYFKKGRVNLPHFQASATKGYTSLAVGRAIQLGYLSMQDLHKPILQFLKKVDQDKLPQGIEKVTLHHTLSMRSGLRINPEKETEIRQQSKALAPQKLGQAYLEQSEAIFASTQSYLYQFIDTLITMLVIDAVVPGTAKDFIKSELLNKLSVSDNFWVDIAKGIPSPGSESSMTSRDMVKWGLLLEQEGRWQGEQLISQKYLAQATSSVATPHSDTYDFSDFRYGYYFWGTKLRYKGKEYDAKSAWGGGGQHVIAINELDLVLAITAHTSMGDDHTYKMIEKRIIPLFVPSQKSKSLEQAHLNFPNKNLSAHSTKSPPYILPSSDTNLLSKTSVLSTTKSYSF